MLLPVSKNNSGKALCRLYWQDADVFPSGWDSGNITQIRDAGGSDYLFDNYNTKERKLMVEAVSAQCQAPIIDQTAGQQLLKQLI